MNYEGIIIRPPSEADSIIIQVTVGCSHNRCTFCGAYKDVDFRIKEDSIVDEDIAFASHFCTKQKRVFLADGDALSLNQQKLVNLFRRINSQLPQVNRISLYANGKSIRHKSLSDLLQLKSLGLSRIYLGIESGDDLVLERICKAERADTLLEAGLKAKKAGIFLSTTVIVGIGGLVDSTRHARATAALLNQLQPNQIAALSLMVLENTPLATQVKKGAFQVPDSLTILKEIKTLIEDLVVDRVQFMANHSSNYLPLSGRLSRDKDRLLSEISQALGDSSRLMSEAQRAL